MKRYCIKCYRCKEKFYGKKRADVIKDNDLKISGRFFYCNCKIVDKFVKTKKKKFGLLDDSVQKSDY